MRGTSDEYVRDLLGTIDTEEQQLQAISDLWMIIKAQPKYKKLKDPILKESDDPKQVLHYVLKKLGALACGNDWNIDIYKEGKRTRFLFVVKKFYPNYKVRPHEHFLPLDFLPALKKKDEQLHDMIIETVALVSKKVKIPLWDEDGDYSKAAEYLWSNVEKPYSSSRIIANYNAYTEGIPFEYLQKINARKRVATKQSLYKMAEGYFAKSERQRLIMGWIANGVDLSEKKDCIANHSYIPLFDSDRERCITPFRKYKFIWCNHHNDLLNTHATKLWVDDNKKYGKYQPVSFSITKPGEKVKQVNLKDFPGDLDEFMGLGEYYFTRKHEQYFYKNTRKQHYSPWEI